MKARPVDTLTINSITDLGPRTAEAFDCISELKLRGVTLNYEAVADCWAELWQKHRQHVANRKSWNMMKAKEKEGINRGGAPSKLDKAIAVYNEVKTTGISLDDARGLHPISKNRFHDHIKDLGWQWPIQGSSTDG